MAIDVEQLVLDQLDPVLALDPTIGVAVTNRVEAEVVLQGWIAADMTDKQKVYISILATKGMIPRLLLKFAQELKRVQAGPAEAEFQETIAYLKVLQEELTEQASRAALAVAP